LAAAAVPSWLLGIAGVFFRHLFRCLCRLYGKSDAVTEVMKRAGESKVVQEQLGTPLEKGWLTTGHLETANGSNSAEVQVPIEGPKGSGRIRGQRLQARR
jgi:hypothetical protein